jgi:hypothetical protein
VKLMIFENQDISIKKHMINNIKSYLKIVIIINNYIAVEVCYVYKMCDSDY